MYQFWNMVLCPAIDLIQTEYDLWTINLFVPHGDYREKQKKSPNSLNPYFLVSEFYFNFITSLYISKLLHLNLKLHFVILPVL